MPFKHLPISRR